MRLFSMRCACIALLAGFLWSPMAMAKTYTIDFPPAAFTPENNTSSVQLSLYDLYVKSAGSDTKFLAPVNLPDGAVIKSLKSWIMDTSATRLVYCRLYRISKGSFSSEIIANASTTAALDYGTVVITGPADPTKNTVDNSNYTYVIFLYMPPTEGSGIWFRNAEITFEAKPTAVVIPLN